MMPMGVHAPGCAHTWPSARPNRHQRKFLAHVSSKSPLNISPNPPREVIPKMSEFNISWNNSRIRLIFLMQIILKPLFIQIWSIVLKFCFIFKKLISTEVFDFWSKPKMSGFFQNYVRDPRIPTFWNSAALFRPKIA